MASFGLSPGSREHWLYACFQQPSEFAWAESILFSANTSTIYSHLWLRISLKFAQHMAFLMFSYLICVCEYCVVFSEGKFYRILPLPHVGKTCNGEILFSSFDICIGKEKLCGIHILQNIPALLLKGVWHVQLLINYFHSTSNLLL